MKIMKQLEAVLVLLLFIILALPGGLMAQKEEAPPVPDQKARATYYDFDDILIPSELTLDKKNSVVYGTTRSKMGILIFEGRVEPSSLAGFFQNNMQKDGWKVLSSFRYRGYLLNFIKEDRSCVITIVEKSFSTTTEVRVGPIDPGQVR